MNEVDLVDLVRRIRAGDQEAATHLEKTCGPQLHLAIRIWLRTNYSAALRRSFDPEDVCQTVFKSFLIRVAAGQFDLSRPEQVTRLLKAMARKKLAHHVRTEQQQQRDVRRSQSLGPRHELLQGSHDSPSELAATRELLEEFRKRLSSEERQLSELRAENCDWIVIAEKVGGTPEARRKQLDRAIKRIMLELGLEEPGRVAE